REALEIGLVSRVLPSAEFPGRVDEIVGRIAQSPPGALQCIKRLYYALDGRSFADGIALGAATNVEARGTEEFRDGVRHFLARKGGTP
ncbi:MAG: enoyl-CoA hydratase/isomerase family protein, partial [Gemmatimonadaceae bacterium]